MADKEQTFDKIMNVQRMMGAYHHQSMAQHGPMADATRGKGRVLALLKMKDGLSTREMATVLGIRVSSLNETLARLEADDYVERRPSNEDGRIMLVYLTDKGRNEEQPKTDYCSILLAGFEDEELTTLDGYLDRMATSLEARLGPDWKERHDRAKRHHERMFQANGAGRGHHGHRGPRGPHGFHHPFHGHAGSGSPSHAYERRCPEPAQEETCDHNCRTCMRAVCVRHGM